MARKPSTRSRSFSESVGLNLIPYLDIVINIIMFMLFTSTGLLQIGVINVNAPKYQDQDQGSAMQENQPPDEKQINLTVGITYQGLFIAGVGGVIGGSSPDIAADAQKGPTIPLLTNDPICRDSMAKRVPPPASCYDLARLTRELIKIKNVFPNETKVIIYAQPDVPYETLVKVMDSSRQEGERALFYDVILSPEIA
jgi:biopolymer transport protein TolR